MTSANRSGMPICRTDEEVRTDLPGLCDLILSHDRDILLRVDDSVVTLFEEEPYMIRRSRGYAPLPIYVNGDFHGTVLSAGGELKNTVCLAKDNLFYLSPHIGDVGCVRTETAQHECAVRLRDYWRLLRNAVLRIYIRPMSRRSWLNRPKSPSFPYNIIMHIFSRVWRKTAALMKLSA